MPTSKGHPSKDCHIAGMESVVKSDLLDSIYLKLRHYAMSRLTVSVPRKTYDAVTGLWSVEWDVGGAPVRLSSRHELTPRTEGIAAAFFFHSLALEKPLDLPEPLDPVFGSNLAQAGAIAQDYWGLTPRVQSFKHGAATESCADAQAMFFTSGVDSFHTLRRNLATVSALINVFGFDIATDDLERFEKSQAGLQHAADTLGLELISVRTELRQHPIFRKLSWERTHVAALSFVAHCLPDHLSQVRVASSDTGPPWGSDVALDKLWSSSALEVINDEPDRLGRYGKMKTLVDWAPAKETLKVCWQNLSDDLNCGYCEKCLRTQFAIVAAGGDLSEFKTFPPTDLAARVAEIPLITSRGLSQWHPLLKHAQTPEHRAALAKLIRRSVMANLQDQVSAMFRKTKGRVRRRILQPVGKVLGI